MNYSSNAQIHKEAISSSNKLQESLLEAVEILHNGFIANEQISKVIECNIIDDSKKAQGIYTVDYMNSKFEVNCYIEETYNVGDIVFVLIPDGDFAKTKMILGSSDGSGQGINWVTQEELNAAVATLQRNFQAGVEAIGAACTRKGSPPASSSLEDTITAIDAIQTGGNYDTLDVSFGPIGTIYNADDYPNIDAQNIVRVVPPEAPFTVRFFADDRTTILKTDTTVPYAGNATCTDLDGTIVNGEYFKGWNPNPTNVKEDIDCYPIRGEYQISSGEIEDSWETICALKGAGYPLGSFKTLHFTVPAYTYDMVLPKKDGTSEQKTVNVSAKEILMHMVKVAEGEDSSTSSQISKNAFKLPFPNTTILRMDLGMYPYQTSVYGSYGSYINRDWANCEVRKYLQSNFYNAMPQSLRDTIKPVTKYYKGVTSYTDNYPNKAYKSCIDTIWIPSTKECYTMIGQENVTGWSYPSECEPNGIDYTAVYTPTFRPDGDISSYVYMVTRTIASNGYPVRRTNQSNWRADVNGTSNTANGVAFGFCL